MNRDFISIKSLDGELKLSHKKRDFGLTVSTHEMVIQKPHINYHIKLQDIISIIPFQPERGKPVRFVNSRSSTKEVTHVGSGSGQYRFYVKNAVMHNRSGMFQMGSMEFVIPVMSELLERIAEYAGLGAVATG